jgi:uncharacterized RDD family membrane protein YckC/RNA polymerase subunit RPABC4/transcription elongation factor Spt4
MNCQKCGAELDSDDVFCPECGMKVAPVAVCPYCGGQLEEDDEFCPGCGKAVEIRKTPPKPPAEPKVPKPEPPPKPPEQEKPKPVQEPYTPPPIRYAGFWMRFFALVLDLIFVPIIFSPLIVGAGIAGYFFGAMNPHFIDDNYLYQFAAGVGGIAYSLIFFFYFLIGHSFGATIGKKIVGIRLTTYNGSNPGFWRALIRETIGRFIASIIFYLGYLWIAWDAHKQGWHDKLAGTFCVRTR